MQVSLYDSTLAAKVANYYLDELDNKIRNERHPRGEDPREDLDEQMKSTSDPWMMQKLQALAEMQFEKSMMASGSSFDVLETPMVPLKKSKPKRAAIVALSFILGICLTGAGIYLWDYAKGKYPGLF